ncbi:hypothetical protein [Paenibacillus monticola]|uniref:Uncharacterized protein n=1 Tax=Paenibacillus monticola TaxID=2666075 RepID=A0A7X2H6X8_9BACL|nr:hypothetical protein [Paenibacillus monticola]MRN54674.1 hypothetical protein [Paenibacillus monticola]
MRSKYHLGIFLFVLFLLVAGIWFFIKQRDRTPDFIQSGTLGSVQLTVHRIQESDLADDSNLAEVKGSDVEQYDIYELSLTAHSGDISEFLDKEKVTLLSPTGENISIFRWLSVNKDSHHPTFLAWFTKVETTPVQMKIMGPDAKNVSLTWSDL